MSKGWRAALVAAVAAWVGAGCGDATAPSVAPRDGAVSPDGVPDVVTADTAPAEVPDTSAPSPCEGFVCPEVPNRCSADHTEALSFAPGVCDDSTGQPVCAAVPTAEACGAAGLCMTGACREIGSFCDFPLPDRASLLAAMVPAGLSATTDPATGDPDDQCCTDFDGDGRVDNGFTDVLVSLAPLMGPPEDVTMGSVARATPVYGLYGVDDVANDPAVTLIVTEGEFYDPAAGTISIAEDGFFPGTVHPLGAFTGAIVDGVFRSDVGYYSFVFGTVDNYLAVRLTDARIAFSVVPAPDGSRGFSLGAPPDKARAWLSGLSRIEDFLHGLNVTARNLCTCTSFEDPLEPVIDIDSRTCKPVEVPPNCHEPESMCRLLTDSVDVCSVMVSLMVPDVDLDGNGVADYVSAGLWLEGAPIRVDGREYCH